MRGSRESDVHRTDAAALMLHQNADICSKICWTVETCSRTAFASVCPVNSALDMKGLRTLLYRALLHKAKKA